MQKIAITVASAFVLAILRYCMWFLVQPTQESTHLAITWQTGTGKAGSVTGVLRDNRGNPVPNQLLTLQTPIGPTQTQTDTQGRFAAEIPSAAVLALEIPGIEPFKFSPAIPNAQQGVALAITIKQNP